MRKIIIFFILTINLIFLIVFPSPFKDLTYQIINLFLTFYIPALFPTIFLINMIFKTGLLQSLYITHRRLAKHLISLIIIFGGTPTFLSLKEELVIEEKSSYPLAFIGPSFSYIYFIFFPNLGYYALLIALASILIRYLLTLVIKSELVLKVYDNPKNLYTAMIKVTKSSLNSLFSLFIVTVKIFQN